MRLLSEIDSHLQKFIAAQSMFFVSTAPLSAEAHLNLSPKGLDSFRILGPRRVGYLDLTGSGVETIAHLKENGRIILMFCAFQGPPNILRLHGQGRAVELHSPEFAEFAPQFPAHESVRSIIVVEVTRITESCGYNVPLMKFEGTRKQHSLWVEKKGAEGLKAYRKEKNRRSIDDLEGLSE